MNKIKIWNTEKVNETLFNIENGIDADLSCFYENDINLRRGNIIFKYSKEEQEEIIKCASDIIYFANNYCYAMTDDGIRKITLRDYQIEMLKKFQNNRFIILLASRQIGKTITSAIFITWYMTFHHDRNILVIANKMATSLEIVDKIKIIYKNLPFFLKPGILSWNAGSIKLDNGTRLFSQSTTKTSAIGYTIHLLYADEFAHIHPNFLIPFYRSIYPTLSSSNVSKIIISSTPNGMNLFYELYKGAIEKKNEYIPIRVDWWQVPGRDENWKKREIANLGSEELFNQEYGNQFISSSKMFLSYDLIQFLNKIKIKFINKNIDILDSEEEKWFFWHPNFDPNNFDENDKFIFSIDLSDGVGRDYTVCNIFKVELLSIAQIRKIKKVSNEIDFFRLKQVGMFRSNLVSVENFSQIIDKLIFNHFNPDNVRIVLEINFKGNLFYEILSRNKNFYPEIFLHTFHTNNSNIPKVGIKIKSDNKNIFISHIKNLLRKKRIVIYDEININELMNFGMDKNGNFVSQHGHDDTVMTIINLSPFFKSSLFSDIIEEIYDNINEKYKLLINKKLNENYESDDFNIIDILKEFI